MCWVCCLDEKTDDYIRCQGVQGKCIQYALSLCTPLTRQAELDKYARSQGELANHYTTPPSIEKKIE